MTCAANDIAWSVPVELVLLSASHRMRAQLADRQAAFCCLMKRTVRVERVAAMLYAVVEFDHPQAAAIRAPLTPVLENR